MEKEYFRVKMFDDNEEDMGYLLVAHDNYGFLKGPYRGSLFTTESFNSEYVQTILNNLNYKYVIEYCTDKKINRSYIFRC